MKKSSRSISSEIKNNIYNFFPYSNEEIERTMILVEVGFFKKIIGKRNL
jgi:hypothetical protein